MFLFNCSIVLGIKIEVNKDKKTEFGVKDIKKSNLQQLRDGVPADWDHRARVKLVWPGYQLLSKNENLIFS